MMTMEDIAAKREAIRLKKLQEENSAKTENGLNGNANETEETKTNDAEILIEDEKLEFLAFARVFSGTLKKNQTLFILSPKHDPDDFVGKVKFKEKLFFFKIFLLKNNFILRILMLILQLKKFKQFQNM